MAAPAPDKKRTQDASERRRKPMPTPDEIERDFERTRAQADEGDDHARRRLPALCKRLNDAREAKGLPPIDPETFEVKGGGPLTAWDRYQLACHKDRPLAFDYIQALFTEWTELHGDRSFGDDHAVLCGTARFENQPIMVVAQYRGRGPKELVSRNFGMMHPEGYRKALRFMKLAAKFGLPVIIFIDTKGAYPGDQAEKRGQAEAIARNIRDMFGLEVPIVAVVLGEGASGGALGIGVGDRVLMMENSWYSVISPEGCAAILWNDPSMKARAAEALRISAADVLSLGLIDEIVPEPNGGAHKDSKAAFEALRASLIRHLDSLAPLTTEELLAKRGEKYRRMGVFQEV